MGKELTINAVKDSVSKYHRTMITEEFVNKLNKIIDDDIVAESFRENFLSYSNVMKNGNNYSLDDYKNAVMFVTFKMFGNSDIDAYMKTFPDRYDRLRREGLDRSAISAYVTPFKNGKLVVQLLEQSLVPTRVVNAPYYQEALNIQMNLARSARSEKVRSDAAKAVMDALKQPEEAVISIKQELDDETKANQNKLIEHIGSIAESQQALVKAGYSLEEIQKLNIRREEDIEEAEIE